MHDDHETVEGLRHKYPHLAPALDRVPKRGEASSDEGAEESCPGFGYLRGVRDRAFFLELRFRDGNTMSFSYSWLGTVTFNPSVGLLLKFTGDLVYLVLIRGSNLDALPTGRAVNLTDRGINRHRILWVREMDEEELRRAGEGEATIDRIEVGEFETHADLTEWLKKNAPAFVRPM